MNKTRKLLSATFLIFILALSAALPTAAKTVSATTGNKYVKISAGNTYNVTQSTKTMKKCLEFTVQSDGYYDFIFTNYKSGAANICFEIYGKRNGRETASYDCGAMIAENKTWVKKAKNFTNAEIKKRFGDDVYRLRRFCGKSESAAVKTLKNGLKNASVQANVGFSKFRKGDVVYIYLSPAADSYKCSYKLNVRRRK